MSIGVLVFLVLGLALLIAGAELLVRGASRLALRFGISPLVVGLTVVATSIVAALRGERDIAVGNVVGSNIFNLLSIGGIAALVTPGGLQIAPSLVRFDLPVMAAVAFACLPIFATGHLIARWEGALFVAYYAAYVTFLMLAATEHDALPPFSGVMLGFVLPLTVVTLLVLWARHRAKTDAPSEPG